MAKPNRIAARLPPVTGVKPLAALPELEDEAADAEPDALPVAKPVCTPLPVLVAELEVSAVATVVLPVCFPPEAVDEEDGYALAALQ